MRKLVLSLLLLAPLASTAEGSKRSVVWDLKALFKTPKVHKTGERPAKGLRSFFYEGATYKGKPTWVFAYYATPGDPPPREDGLP